MKNSKDFIKLVDIFKKLRAEDGCAWDKKQTHSSLIKYLFEESNELKTAIKKHDIENIKEELGDVLLQVIFHCQIANENKWFDINDVIKNLNKKLIRRHPHVFGKSKAKTEQEIIKQWAKIKKKEKKLKKQPFTI
ncbi:hypothetical protein MASR1M68_10700 [Elusimicrobiota bacterium]